MNFYQLDFQQTCHHQDDGFQWASDYYQTIQQKVDSNSWFLSSQNDFEVASTRLASAHVLHYAVESIKEVSIGGDFKMLKIQANSKDRRSRLSTSCDDSSELSVPNLFECENTKEDENIYGLDNIDKDFSTSEMGYSVQVSSISEERVADFQSHKPIFKITKMKNASHYSKLKIQSSVYSQFNQE